MTTRRLPGPWLVGAGALAGVAALTLSLYVTLRPEFPMHFTVRGDEPKLVTLAPGHYHAAVHWAGTCDNLTYWGLEDGPPPGSGRPIVDLHGNVDFTLTGGDVYTVRARSDNGLLSQSALSQMLYHCVLDLTITPS